MQPTASKTPDDAVETRLLELLAQIRNENDALKEKVATLEHFRELAYRDALTGSFNRRYLEEQLDREIHRTERSGTEGLSVILVDVDAFKAVNDTHGHTVGDAVLRWVAKFLEDNTRVYDVVGRLGGDEFLVILPRTGALEASQVLARLRERLEVQYGAPVPVELSLGLATWPWDGGDVRTLLAAADRAMYRDKARRDD